MRDVVLLSAVTGRAENRAGPHRNTQCKEGGATTKRFLHKANF